MQYEREHEIRRRAAARKVPLELPAARASQISARSAKVIPSDDDRKHLLRV